jgi:hypothetical protein
MTVRQSVHYDVVAISITIFYNREGDHDHNGMMFALSDNLPILEYIRALARVGQPQPNDSGGVPLEDLRARARRRAREIGVEVPSTPRQAK